MQNVKHVKCFLRGFTIRVTLKMDMFDINDLMKIENDSLFRRQQQQYDKYFEGLGVFPLYVGS